MNLPKTRVQRLISQFLVLVLVTLLVLPVSFLAQENASPTNTQAALSELPKDAEVPSIGPDGIPTMLIASTSLGTVPAIAQSNQSAQADQLDDAEVDTALRAAVLPKVAAVFRLDSEDLQLREVRQIQSGEEAEEGQESNTTVAVYDQVKDGLEVVGGELAVVINQEGEVTAVSSTARGGQNVDATPEIGQATARETALEYVSNSRPEAQINDVRGGRLAYVLASRDYGLHLAYAHTVAGTSNNEPFADIIYTDADSNRVVEVHPKIHTALNRQIYTANGTFNLPGTPRRFEGQPASPDQTVNINYSYIGITYNWYRNLFNRDSYDNRGGVLRSSVHVGFRYNNAFWNGNQFGFGDGDGVQAGSYAYALDITSHEVTHAMTQYTSNLVYRNESGALNEAWSDIFGAVVEARERLGPNGYNADTWKVGEDIVTPGIPGDAGRYMDDPVRDGQSRDFYPLRYLGPLDDGGVHWNSGIANLAFKLVVTGGRHPRGRTNVLVQGIGIDKARQIFYRANAVYLRPNSNFEHARASTAQAAQDLYGRCRPEYVAVQRAWDAVGVPGRWSCSGGPGGDVHFSTYGNGNYDWHGAGCYVVAQAADPATSSLRFEMDAVPFPPNPGTSVARRVAFTFPDTSSPHTVTLSITAPHLQLNEPAGGADTTFIREGDPNQSATWRFYEIGGAGRLLGTIVVLRHDNGVFEYSAVYDDGSQLRAFVSPNVVVDANLHPGWNLTLRGMAGVFPVQDNLLSRTLQPYSIFSLQTNIVALNEFAASWACTPGGSLFDAPATSGEQGSILTVDPDARPAAEQACIEAGLSPSDTDCFENCVFDVASGGETLGLIMAAHAGAVCALQSQPPPPPAPTPTPSPTPTASPTPTSIETSTSTSN